MSTFSELIDFTRSSTGTYLDSVVYGDELVTNGSFDTDSDWDKQNGWSITNGEAVYATGTGREILQISIPTVAGKTYKVEFDITSRVVGAVGAYSLESVQNSATYKSTVGPYVRFLTATGSVMALRIRSSAVSANLSIDNVSLKEVIGGQGTSGTPLLRTADTNEPRLEYDASGQPLGLLIEEQRTNLVLNSVNASSDNATTNVTQTANQENSLTGTNDAFLLQANTTGTSYSGQATSPTSGTSYTASRFAKAGASNFAQLSMGSSGFGNQVFANFDLNTGTVAQESNCVAVMTNMGSGWYRCSISAQAVSTTSASTPHYFSAVNSGTAPIRTSEAGNSVYFYGSQTEEGAFPTSYIPTSGSTVTRNTDVCRIEKEKYHLHQKKGTIYCEFDAITSTDETVLEYQRIYELATTNSDSRVTAWIKNSDGTFTSQVYDNNVTQAGYALEVGYNGKLNTIKLASTYGVNHFQASNDGKVSNVDTSVALDYPRHRLAIMQRTTSGSVLCGHMKRITYTPKVLTEAQLIELTKPSSSPTMSLTFDGQATSELVEGLHD